MNYVFIGWCKEDNHDKVWGIIQLALDVTGEGGGHYWAKNRYVSFWGRRGAKLQTKVFECEAYHANTMFKAKEKKGYKSIDRSELDKVYPEFQDDLEKTAVWAMLSN